MTNSMYIEFEQTTKTEYMRKLKETTHVKAMRPTGFVWDGRNVPGGKLWLYLSHNDMYFVGDMSDYKPSDFNDMSLHLMKTKYPTVFNRTEDKAMRGGERVGTHGETPSESIARMKKRA
jgi:hypothetical protein